MTTHSSPESESPYDESGRLKSERARPEPRPNGVGPSQGQYLAVVRAAIDIAAARVFGLIATTTACGGWLYAIYDPNPARTYAAAAFSVSVLFPIVALYWKRG